MIKSVHTSHYYRNAELACFTACTLTDHYDIYHYSSYFRSLDGVTGGDEYELTGDDTEYHSDPVTKQTRQVYSLCLGQILIETYPRLTFQH